MPKTRSIISDPETGTGCRTPDPLRREGGGGGGGRLYQAPPPPPPRHTLQSPIPRPVSGGTPRTRLGAAALQRVTPHLPRTVHNRWATPRDVVAKRGGGGVWNPKMCVSQKQPKSTFPFANFIFVFSAGVAQRVPPPFPSGVPESQQIGKIQKPNIAAKILFSTMKPGPRGGGGYSYWGQPGTPGGGGGASGLQGTGRRRGSHGVGAVRDARDRHCGSARRPPPTIQPPRRCWPPPGARGALGVGRPPMAVPSPSPTPKRRGGERGTAPHRGTRRARASLASRNEVA